MAIGPLAHGRHGDHDNGVGQTQSTGPSQRSPLRIVGDGPHKISGKHSGDDHRGVTRVGKVVHGPAKDLSAFDTRIQHGNAPDAWLQQGSVQMARSASTAVAPCWTPVVASGRFAQLERADQIVKAL